MYVFAHNSESGEHATISQSIHGEDLPYVFGAPLGAAGPFQDVFNAEERLLSEATMRYFTNFAKTGKPTSPVWTGRFMNMNPIDWEKYDVDWQEFNEINQNYLHLGIPPIVSQRYRHRFTKYWNDGLIETLKLASAPNVNIYGKPISSASASRRIPQISTGQISMYPIKVEIDGEANDPVRELRHRLQQQSRNSIQTPSISASTESINYEQISSDESEIFKTETTTILLISVIVAFLVVNLMGLSVYLYRRNKKLKGESINIFDDKASKFNDTDDSFILRKSNNTYESVKRHSPINGYGITRQTSTSTVDTHTKVSDWMFGEAPRTLHPNSFAKREKVSVAVDATPQARSNSILRQEPIEITKAKSFDFGNCGRIVCQQVDMDMSMIDEIPFREFRERTESDSSECSSCSHCEECAINKQHSYSDSPEKPYHQEEITSFIEASDVNVTSREEGEKFPLSPEESLKAIQKMNCPKVLPNYPENLQFNDSTKRRSLQIPPQYYQIHNTLSRDDGRSRPDPPPRMSSTLGRRAKPEVQSGFFMSEPMRVEEPPADPEPEITTSSLVVGPLIPRSENIYMSMQRKQSLIRQNSLRGQKENSPLETFSSNNREHLYAEIIKNSRVQVPQDGIYSITTSTANKKLQTMDSQESNSSSSEDSSTGTIKEI